MNCQIHTQRERLDHTQISGDSTCHHPQPSHPSIVIAPHQSAHQCHYLSIPLSTPLVHVTTNPTLPLSTPPPPQHPAPHLQRRDRVPVPPRRRLLVSLGQPLQRRGLHQRARLGRVRRHQRLPQILLLLPQGIAPARDPLALLCDGRPHLLQLPDAVVGRRRLTLRLADRTLELGHLRE